MGLCWAHYRRELRYGETTPHARLAAQGNRCAACGTDDPGNVNGWVTDHDHVTGEVRGILCHGCNIGLGAFKDSIDRLQRAIRYLRQRGQGQRELLSAVGRAAGCAPQSPTQDPS